MPSGFTPTAANRQPVHVGDDATLGLGIHTSTSDNALAVGPAGMTNPTLQVDASTTNCATGVKVKGAAAAGGVAVSVVSSGTNENLTIDAKGSGTVTVGATSTGVVQVGNATNPALKVTQATAGTGINVTSAAAAGGVAVAAISSGAAENLTIDAKGTGTITLAGTSTGNVVIPRAIVQGTDATDRVVVKGIYMSPANVVTAVPSITDPDTNTVAVDVSGAFSMAPAVGDAVIAIPQEALPTNCALSGAFVSATDTITVAFASVGGNVTGANKNFKFLVIDLT
jgi:hypothetical protein